MIRLEMPTSPRLSCAAHSTARLPVSLDDAVEAYHEFDKRVDGWNQGAAPPGSVTAHYPGVAVPV
jgi:hypothetical protein